MLAYTGFFYAPAAHASVLMPGSLPLWTALLAAWVLRDRITPARALGLALIVAGDLLVGGRSLLHAFEGGEVWKGDLLFMSAAFCWACYSVVARRHGLDAVRATIAHHRVRLRDLSCRPTRCWRRSAGSPATSAPRPGRDSPSRCCSRAWARW